MNYNLGIPYMGGKRKIADEIIDFIISENPNVKYIYDLFGGGGAISFYAMQQPKIKKVFYNELNTGVVELLKKIQKDGVTKDFYNWVSREEFIKHKNDSDWYGGLLKTCWSFGNNQGTYLFSKEIEEDKRLLHEIIVNDCEESLNIFNKKHDIKIQMENKQFNMFDYQESINEKRFRIMSYIKNDSRFERLQQLEQLERLQQLQHLERLQQLDISNLSYEKVKIETPINETIIYLDPPYINTWLYQEKINHNKLYNYIENSPYTIYLSSYESNLPCVLKIEHNTTLSSIANNKVIERLFTNKKDRTEGRNCPAKKKK